MSNSTCATEECGKPTVARGYCRTHYMRWSRHGDPVVVKVVRGAICDVDNCGRPAKGRGFCDQHYKRVMRHGDPTVRLRNYVPEGQSYKSIHRLLKSLHGPARLHACAKCGEDASDWAYDHADPSEYYDDRGCPFSSDPERYMPLCRQCHCIFDQIGVKR